MFTVLSLAAAGAMASPFHPWAAPQGMIKRADCTAVDVNFHFNDTTIGTTQSCSVDVMFRGGAATTRRSNNKKVGQFHSKTRVAASAEDCDEDCVDGASTNYTVISGDTLEKIAAEYNSGVCNIASANSLDDPDFISVGQVLTVPTNVCTADNDSCRTEEGTATCVAADAGVAATYTIVAGDTFFLIAAELGITLDAIVAANPNVNPGALEVGQIINIPICDA